MRPDPDPRHPTDIHIEVEVLGDGQDDGVPVDPDRAAHRRRVGTVLTVLALVALGVWLAVDPGRPSPHVAPTPSSTPSEPTDPALMRALSSVGALDSAEYLPGLWSGRLPARVAYFINRSDPVPAGTYELRVACVGDGVVIASWQAIATEAEGLAVSAGEPGSVEVACDDRGLPSRVEIVLEIPGRLVFMAEARDGTDPGGPVFAASFCDPRLEAVLEDVASVRHEGTRDTFSGSGVSDGVLRFGTEGAAGSYALVTACRGDHDLRFEVAFGRQDLAPICRSASKHCPVSRRPTPVGGAASDGCGWWTGWSRPGWSAPSCGPFSTRPAVLTIPQTPVR